LSDDALGFTIQAVLKSAPLDQGVGDRGQLKALVQSLQTKVRFKGLDYLALEQLTSEIERDYLLHWARALAQPEPPAKARTGR
jgi:hypothetical protein